METLINNSTKLLQIARQLATKTSNILPVRETTQNDSDENGSGALAERRLGDNVETTRESVQSSDDEQDDEEDDGQQLGEQMARLRMKGFSSSALCLNNETQRGSAVGLTAYKARGKPSGAKPSDSSKSRSGSRQASNIRPRCDNDTQLAAESSGGIKTTPASNGRDQTLTRRGPAATGAKIERPKIKVSALGAAEDPIVKLARLRRPSVSNQGTLNVDQQALFSAVECNQLERVKSILDDAKVNVNSLNGDKLTCLDVAVLLRNSAMVRLLQQYKAKESSAYLTREGRENQLYSLYLEARRLVEDLSRSIGAIATPTDHLDHQAADQFSNANTLQNKSDPDDGQSSGCGRPEQQQLMLATGSLLSSALFEEKQRQLQYWRRRLDLFMQMRYGFEKLDLPSVPELVVLQVVGENSLGLKIVHSLGQINELFSSLRRQQQQQQSSQNSRQMNSQLAGVKPMSRLIDLAHERRLYCPSGPKCSHWLIDELVAYRQNSDQFQSYDSNDLLVRRPFGGDQTNQNVEVRQRQVRESAYVKFQARNSSALQNSSSSSLARGRQQQQREKLAIFNQLLAQQLTILSQQQRHQQQLDLLQSSRSKPVQQNQPNSHQHQLIYAHQIESTDSAYDNIAAAVASSRQQQQQQVALQLGAVQAAALDLNQRDRTAGAYRSLAYQLMTARRYNHLAEQMEQMDQVDQSQENGGAKTSRTKLYSTSSAKVFNQSELSRAQCAVRGPFEPRLTIEAQLNNAIEPSQLQSDSMSTIITKYKVEWSTNASFEPVSGSMIVYNTGSYPLECQIGNLDNGQSYFVRVSSGNHKGFSGARLTTPACLAPSSWRQVNQQQSNARAGPTTSGHGIPTALPAAAASSQRKKFKYDEEVFRKFTKLILLNKHILDENQLNWLQREQQRLQLEGETGCGASRTGLGWGSSKWAANKMANLQNKSSLINMLLLDATMPANVANNLADKSWPSEHNNSSRNSTGSNSLSPAICTTTQQFQISASSSPRGSLYPVTSALNADNDNDSILSGQSNNDQQQQQQQQQSSLKVRKNLRNFFQSNSAKFNKLNNQNKRGLYLTSLIYNATTNGGQSGNGRKSAELGAGDSALVAGNIKLVVTNDDRLPVIEILNDLVAPSTLMADFYWLLKINGTSWIDMKRLRQQLQRSHSSSTLHLRIKLLAAIEQMQLALNLEDIGRLFYKPIQAHDGSIVICTCRSVANTKQVSNLSIKWTNQHKLIPRHLRKVHDMIALANKQRERLQEQQARQKQQQQEQLARNSLTSSAQLQAENNRNHHNSNCLLQQQICLNKRHSSSAMTSSNGATPTPTRPVSGFSSENLQAACATSNSLILSEEKSVADGTKDFNSTTANQNQQTTSFNLVATFSEAPSSGGGGDQQAHDTRFLSATCQTSGALPAEFGRLCEICQHAIAQRRCTMASGSSSSSLASNESQSWSSSQYSLNSQLAPSSTRSCTCSRSNSSVTASVASQVRLTTTTAITSTASSNSSSNNSQQQALQTGSACCSHLNISSQAISAPASQRNSTSQSTRPASGSVGMMMMMTATTGGNQTSGRHEHHFQSSGSFSLVGQPPSQQQLNATASVSGPSSGSISGPISGQRQTQSQQFNSAECGAGPQSSSTYLMLASLSLYDLLLFHMKEIIEFDQASTVPLKRGLYLGFMQLQTTVESMRLLVPRRRPNMLPCARIRDNAHVSREEWELLKKFASISQVIGPDGQDHHQPTGGRRSGAAHSGRSSKINVPVTVADVCSSPASNASSRSSDPAIWRPRQSIESLGQDQRIRAQANLRPDHSTTQQNCHLLNSATVGFERDRAKSVSPGLINESSTLNGTDVFKAAIGRAQVLARSSREQSDQLQSNQAQRVPHCNDPQLKPTMVHLSSCNIGRSNELTAPNVDGDNGAQTAHAHSDTDLPMSLSSTRTGAQRAATTSEFGLSKEELPVASTCETITGDQLQSASDSNLVADCREQLRQLPIGSNGSKTAARTGATSFNKQKSGSSGSIGTHLQPQLQLEKSPEMTFVRLIGDTAKRLLLELKTQLPKVFDETKLELVSILNSLNDDENNRVYHIELIELSNQVTFILLIPSPENVCPVTSNERSNILAHHPEYMLLPLQIFETIHLTTYEPDLLGKYSRLSTILETDLIVAQHDHRQAFSSNELKSTKTRVSHLQDMVSIADEFWRQLRWIVDVVSFARDKSQLSGQTIDQTSGFIKLSTIWRHFDRLASNPTAAASVTPAAESSCCTSSTVAARKSVESVVLSVADGDNGSQRDTYGSSSSSLLLQDQQQQPSKSPLMKTNSSNSSDQRRRSSGAKAKLSNATDWNETNLTGVGHHQEITRTSSVQAGRLPEIQLPVGAASESAGPNDQSSELDGGKQKHGPEENKSDQFDSKDLEKWTPKSRPEARRDQNFNHNSDERELPQPESNWRAVGDATSSDGNKPFQRAPGNFEERILTVKLDERDHELVLVDQDKEFGGDESRQSDQVEIKQRQRYGGAQEEHEEEEDDGEAAIYAYHISLRDATKAAAKRKSSQQLINLFIDQSEPLAPGEGDWQVTNNEDDAATCGGLNLNKGQLERFKLAALARAELRVTDDCLRSESNKSIRVRATPDEVDGERQRETNHRSRQKSLAQSDFYLGLGEVVAYKFKKVSPNSLPHCSTSAPKTSMMATRNRQHYIADDDRASPGVDATNNQTYDGHRATGVKQVDRQPGYQDCQSGQQTSVQQRRAGQFKSTNPFLTDSFDM